MLGNLYGIFMPWSVRWLHASGEPYERCVLLGHCRRAIWRDLPIGAGDFPSNGDRDQQMSALYVVGAILAGALLVYLLYALIKPEKF
jgi:K+-transporting ATPase KdpF subunit